MKWAMDIGGVASQVAVLVLLTMKVQDFHDNIALTACLPLSAVLVSLTWWPNFVRQFAGLRRLRVRIKENQVSQTGILTD